MSNNRVDELATRRTSQRPLEPLLRWAGSKRQLLKHLLRAVPANYETYVEPFAGSACLFFALRPKRAILGDRNAALIDTYRVIAQHPRLVRRRVQSFGSAPAAYYKLREEDESRLDPIGRAARFVYLNRNCFNGVYRLNRRGRFNVPRGVKTGKLPSEIDFVRCSNALRGTRLLACDYREVIAMAVKGDFVYLDPPYIDASRRYRGEYGWGTFTSADLPELANQLQILDERQVTFLVSYASVGEFRRVAEKWASRQILANRTVASSPVRRAATAELLISNRPPLLSDIESQ